jgi:hypothetical protein
VPIEYFLGKDFHLIVIQHKKEILEMTPELDKVNKFNNFADPNDSVNLMA